MPLPEMYPLIKHPSDTAYVEARANLLFRYLMGDDSAIPVLEDLPRIYHVLSNFDYYSVLYGSRRATRMLLGLLSRVKGTAGDKVTLLLDLYKKDNSYLEPLVDALLEMKLKLVEEGAPENLLKLFDDTVAMADSSKKTAFIRRVQVLMTYVKMFRESGPEAVSRAVDILLNRPASAPGPMPAIQPAMKPPSDADEISFMKYLVDAHLSGSAPTKDDVINYFGGNAIKATAIIRRLKSGSTPKVVYDTQMKGYVLSPIGMKQLLDDGLITAGMARKLVAFMKTVPIIGKLVRRGVFKPPEEVAGFTPGSEEEGEEDEEEE